MDKVISRGDVLSENMLATGIHDTERGKRERGGERNILRGEAT